MSNSIDRDSYPIELIRGLSPNDSITPEGYVTASGFQFDPYDAKRGDNYCELSINWKDDDGAIDKVLMQHKPNCAVPQFSIGYAIVERSKIDIMLKTYVDKLHFSYERCPVEGDKLKDIDDNPYHGNLLVNESVGKQAKKNIQHSLATLAGLAIRR